MPKIVGVLILLIAACFLSGAAAPKTKPAKWKTHVSETYLVTLKYPASWTKIQGYDERYGGRGGFFQLNAIGGEDLSIDDVAQLEAYHKLRPYGSNPTIKDLSIDGQPARLIIPSADQPVVLSHQASLVILAPKPVTIKGEDYRYIVLWADKEHMRQIAGTLRFRDKKNEKCK